MKTPITLPFVLAPFLLAQTPTTPQSGHITPPDRGLYFILFDNITKQDSAATQQTAAGQNGAVVKNYYAGAIGLSAANFQTTVFTAGAPIGGRVSAAAQITIGGQMTTQGVTFYVDGLAIPDATIDNQLTGVFASTILGSGVAHALPYLFSGIAGAESSYIQFGCSACSGGNFTLFGILGRWPNESPAAKFPAGAYVGLMMVPNTGFNQTASPVASGYNWWNDTAVAGPIYATSYSQAVSYQNAAMRRQGCAGLPPMTENQLELNALTYYSGYTSGGPYLIPNEECTAWSGNPNNVNMTNYISGNPQQAYPAGVLQWCAYEGHLGCL